MKAAVRMPTRPNDAHTDTQTRTNGTIDDERGITKMTAPTRKPSAPPAIVATIVDGTIEAYPPIPSELDGEDQDIDTLRGQDRY